MSAHVVGSPRIAIAFSGGPSPSEIVDCVRLAESLGYESAWVAEGHGGDQFAVLAACAVQTSHILLVVGVPKNRPEDDEAIFAEWRMAFLESPSLRPWLCLPARGSV